VPTSELVSRFDVAEIGKPVRTPQGFLRVPAYLTRVGVFPYRRPDGSIVRELRPESEVFHADSIASLGYAPVTDLHPTEMVSPSNVRKLAIGHVSAVLRKDGNRVAGDITIEDEAAIKAVEKGERREVSCGYRCRIDETPGEWNGERYDCVQRGIVYNHAAIGPKNWGRQGRDIALRVDSTDGTSDDDQQTFRLDSGDAVNADTFPAPGERGDHGDDDDAGGGDMDQVTLRVDGLDVQVPKQWAQVIEKGLKTRDDSIAALTKERDTLQGKCDGLSKDLDETKKKLATADDPKRLDAAVNARATLIEQSRRVLPPNHAFEGQTPRQIHEAVLKRLDDKLDLTGRSDEYVMARFDHAIASLGENKGAGRNDALDEARRAITGGGTTGNQGAQRQDSKPQLAPWQQPLAISKDTRH
jgi:hypothetical protein